MWPWTRTSDDPLANVMFHRYQMHVLRLPRADVAVNDAWAMKEGQILPGKLSSLMDPAPLLPDVRTGEPVADLNVVASNQIDAQLGFNFLEAFLSAIGAGAFPLKLKGTLEAKKAAGMRFRFAAATRDYVDPFKLEFQLRKHKVPAKSSLMKPDWKYFVALAVLRTDSINIAAVKEDGTEVQIAEEAVKLAEVNANLSVKKSSGEEITITGGQRLAFAVQLSELVYNGEDRRFELNVVKNVVKVMGKAPEVALETIAMTDDGIV